jgi:transcriptional regulator with XRE-family HTH domain
MVFTASFEDTPSTLLAGIAARARNRRLARGWTQDALATRAGVSRDVVKRLESSGRISLENLARLAIASDASAEIHALFPEVAAQSIDELEKQVAARGRVYGKRKDAGPCRSVAERSASPPKERR